MHCSGIPASEIDDYAYFFTQVETFGGVT